MSFEKLIEKAKGYSLSEEIIEKRENDRLSFVEKFPLDKLKDLSIDQFVQGTDNNSFCYWLEFKKIGFGIGGGNASKYGMYKAKDGNYYSSYGKNKKHLTGTELKEFFLNIKSGIIQALKYTEESEIEKIKTIEIPLWNMVIQKILSMYFPENFFTIGSPDVLIKCAKELQLDKIDLSSDNSIQINYECKKTLSSSPLFSNWSYEKIGTFIWENFRPKKIKKKDIKQYWLYAPGENAKNWDEFYEQEIMGLGWDEIGDLSQYHSRDDIKKALVDAYGGVGSKKNDVSANDDFLNKVRIGDVIIAKKGRGELLGYGIVTSDYLYDENRKGYQKIRKVDWNLKGIWQVGFSLVLKTLTDITKYKSDLADYDFYYERLLGIMDHGKSQKDYQEEFKNWLNTKYGENSGTTSSYIKAIDILSQILSKELFKTTDSNFLSALYNDLIIEQKDEEGKYFNEDAPSYGSNGFYSASIKSYQEFLEFTRESINKSSKEIMHHPLNTILYGPPGTGKTYKLKEDYFPEYTSKETSLSAEQNFDNVVSELSWWQVIALALLELKKAKVAEIYTNRWVQKKESFSDGKTIKATLWSQLQLHTVSESKTVNLTRSQAPLIFDKTKNSYWEIIEEEVREQASELYDILDSVNNFTPNPDKEIKRYVFTTFHQSFAYEDFIEGIKPIMAEDGSEDGELSYIIEPGIFKQICSRAKKDSDNRYAIFIDEINRGNVSQIFGELITLIEPDKRKGAENEMSVVLPYSKKLFSVPKNLDVYGTMNTADRSVEALDTALRRRFSFIEMPPKPKLIRTEGKSIDGKVDDIDLVKLLKVINRRIEKLVDKDHMIGHSYFLSVTNLEDLKEAFQNKIIPLLQEYFFGDYGKIGLVLGEKFFKEPEKESNLDDSFFANFNGYDGSSLLDKPVYHLKNVIKMDDGIFIKALETLLS